MFTWYIAYNPSGHIYSDSYHHWRLKASVGILMEIVMKKEKEKKKDQVW